MASTLLFTLVVSLTTVVTAGDGPFGSNVEVGFSDMALVVVSVLGFGILTATIYNMIYLKTKQYAAGVDDDDEQQDRDNYNDQLQKANVATLSRAQRRARANIIMKQERKIATDPTTPTTTNDNETKSRKERQKLAKELERKERMVLQQERARLQVEAQEAASKRKQERLESKHKHQQQADEERAQLEARQEEALKREWQSFLLHEETQSTLMTVEEFRELCHRDGQVDLMTLSEHYKVPLGQIQNRIETLVKSCRITGIFRQNKTVFYSMTPQQCEKMANEIIAAKDVKWSELATILSTAAAAST